MLLIIGGISCVDALLNLLYPVDANMEENPIARLILLASNNNLALLIAAKASGTVVALAFLKGYYYYNNKVAVPMATVMATIQVLFLIYMVVA